MLWTDVARAAAICVAFICVLHVDKMQGQEFQFSPLKPELRIATIIPKLPRTIHRKIMGWVQRPLRVYRESPDSYNLFQNYSLRWRFDTSAQSNVLDSYSPPEILQVICNVVVGENASVVLFKQDMQSDDNYLAEEYFLKMTAFLGVPVLAYSGLVHPSPQSSILQLVPSIRQQCVVMLKLLSRYRWYSFSILTGAIPGHNYFVETLRELIEEYTDQYKILSVIHISSTKASAIDSQLDKLKGSESRVILLYSSQKQAEHIFESAVPKNLCTEEFIWIGSKTVVGSAEVHSSCPSEYPPGLLAVNYEQADYDDSNTNIAPKDEFEAAVKIWLRAMENIFNDIGHNASLQKFRFSPNYSCAGSPVHDNQTVVIPTHWQDGKILYQYMKNVVLPPERKGQEFRFKEDGTLTDVKLSIFNVNMKRKWKDIGSWTKEGLEINDVTWPNDTVMPPAGRPARYHLRVVTMEEDPYVKYSDPDSNGCPPQSVPCRMRPHNHTIGVQNVSLNREYYRCAMGLSIDLLNRLSNSIGFDFELFHVEDDKWGAYDNNTKQWNGLVRAIMDGDADLVMTSLKITPERNSMIDFSIPYMETGITIIVAVRDGVISPTAFLEPYDYPSWCLILVFSVHASGAAIFIFEWLSPSGLDRGNKPIRAVSEHRFSLFRSFWLIWAMLFGAAVNVDNPRGVSSRFLGNIWALFAVVFTASYTANLAAFMITKEDYDRLTGIKDWRLLHPERHKPPFKFGTIPSGSTDTNIRKTNQKMHQWMSQFNRTSVGEGIKAVKSGELNAFIYDATVLEYRASHDEGCNLRTVGSWYAMTGYGVGFPKGSKWIPEVNKYLAQYQYDGVMERLHKFWLAGVCKKGEQEGEVSIPLGILNFTSAFILLAGGMLLGALLLLLEHIYFKFFRAKLRKWDKCGCCGLVSLSMGKSLTFEQSVREAIDLQRNFKCKNPICETQVWKLKHELDLALLKIERLQRQNQGAIAYDKRAVWKEPESSRNPHAIGWKPDLYPQGEYHYHPDTSPSCSTDTPGEGFTRLRRRDVRPGLADPYSQSTGRPDKHQPSNSPYEANEEPHELYSSYPSSHEPNQETPLLSPPQYSEVLSTPISEYSSSNYIPSTGISIRLTDGKPLPHSQPPSPIRRPVAGPSSQMATTDLIGQSSDPNGPISINYGGPRNNDQPESRPINKDKGTIEKETVL